MRWWRAYEDSYLHPKLCGLTDREFRVWYNLLCIASKNDGLIPSYKVASKLLALRYDYARSLINKLVATHLIEECNGEYIPHNWLKRQYKSDFSKERTKRWRDGHVTAAVTAPYTETDTETEKKKKIYRSPLPENWSLSEIDLGYAREKKGWANDRIFAEGERFKNHYLANGKAHKDWHRAWCNWVTSPYQQQKGMLNGSDREDGKARFKAALRKLGACDESQEDAGGEVIQFLPAAGRGE